MNDVASEVLKFVKRDFKAKGYKKEQRKIQLEKELKKLENIVIEKKFDKWKKLNMLFSKVVHLQAHSKTYY